MQSTVQVTEYKIGKATVRMHGTPDREKVEAATMRLIKKARLRKKALMKEANKK